MNRKRHIGLYATLSLLLGLATAGWADERCTLSLAFDPPSPIVHQPFQLIVSIQVPKLPSPFEKESPIHHRAQPPKLLLPLLANPFDGLDIPNPDTFINSFSAQQTDPAIHVNDYSINTSPFPSMFTSPFDLRPARIAPAITPPAPPHPDHFQYELRIPLCAHRTGTFTIQGAQLTGDIIANVNPTTGRPIFARVHTKTPSLSLSIQEPPLAGRPVSYIGVSATNLTTIAELDTQTCTVGTPLKLNLTITGTDTPSSIHTPRLDELIDIARTFRLYSDVIETETLDQGRRFTYTLRPVEAGTLEIPPIPISYYDYSSGTYRTVHTDPLPVRAIPVTQLRTEDVVGEVPASVALDKAPDLLSRSAPLIFPVPVGPTRIIQPRLHGMLLGGAPCLFLLVIAIQTILNHLPHRKRALTRKRAAQKAIRQLTHAPDKSAQLVVSVIRQFTEERFGASATSATPGDIRAILEAHISKALVAELTEIFEIAFNAAFSGSSWTGSEHVPTDAAECIQRIDDALRKGACT